MAYLMGRFSHMVRWSILLVAITVFMPYGGGVLPYTTQAQAKPQDAAKPQATAKSEEDAAVESATRLDFAEEVRIRIPEYRALSGEYRIGADGTVALPGIGRLNVSKLSVAEFERYLKSEIYRVSNRESNVAVEVIRYRSVYVSGAVAQPGAFPWQPGLSVVQVEALAGGVARRDEQQNASPFVLNRERERNFRAEYDLAASIATIERLKTEKKGGSVYIIPERVAKLVDKEDVKRLSARQQALLNSRKVAFDTRVRALHNRKTLAASEKNALELQRVRLKRQLASRNALQKRLRHMAKQGYSRADRVFEEQVRVALLEERLTTATLGISRMAMAEATAQQELEALVSGRHAQIDLELLDLEQRVGQLEIQLANARKKATKGGKQPDGGPQVSENLTNLSEVEPTYGVIRRVSGKTVVLEASRTTSLQPGDVLVVSLK